MNPATWNLYKAYLERVNDPSAAAALTLADALQSQVTRPLDTDRPMTVPEVAKLLRVKREKVLLWIRSGRLRGFNVTEKVNGWPKYRVNPEDLETFTRLQVPIPPASIGRPRGSRNKVLTWPTLPKKPKLQ